MYNVLNDPRMRFRNAKDPVYVAFNYLDKQPLDRLAKVFVNDLIQDGKRFLLNIKLSCTKTL